MAECELDGRVLGVSWDGTGYGLDGTVWGGEFLLATRRDFVRAAHLRTFLLPGGDAAVREPRRSALGILWEVLGASAIEKAGDLPTIAAFAPVELGVHARMLEAGVNSPRTSSAGRLFDAVASLTGLRHRSRFEGQAAMELELAATGGTAVGRYHLDVPDSDGGREGARRPLVADWGPLILEAIEDVRNGASPREVSLEFHEALASGILAVARRVGEERVVLTGGCFQNRRLTERAVALLREAGFRPYWHQRVPPNDGGVALGQAVCAAARMSAKP
jgi:hydrogenase maturation protein HypF